MPKEKPARQMPLFTKATGAAALKQAQWRARPLTDGSFFPFGKNRKDGKRMHEVELSWYRWFLSQDWSGEWPAVADYAREILAPEREQTAQFTSPKRPTRATTPSPSDPAKAAAAIEEFSRQTQLLRES